MTNLLIAIENLVKNPITNITSLISPGYTELVGIRES